MQSDLIWQCQSFSTDAAEQILLIFASMLAPDATTVLCSTILLRHALLPARQFQCKTH